MTTSYLRQASEVDHLYKAWSHISDSTKSLHRHTAGIDGQSVNQFAAKADNYLNQLRGTLRSESGYQFSLLKAHLESKTSGGDRVICIPTVQDRIVQRAILDILSETAKYSFESNVSYGFIKGRSVRQAIQKALAVRQSRQWAYKTDISKFFDTLNRARVHDEIRRRIRVPTLHDLLIRATCCEVKARDRRQQKRIHKAGIREGIGLRQGMPISPYLANLFLWEFDHAVMSKDFAMVRYADDLIFFANSESDCEEIHLFCTDRLAEIGLSVDPVGQGKTFIAKPNESVEFLGISIDASSSNYAANVPGKKINDCRAELMSLGDLDVLLGRELTISTLMQKLNGKITGWTEAYNFCANAEQLTHVLNSSRRKAIESIFTKGLGMQSLTEKQRRFLEIE